MIKDYTQIKSNFTKSKYNPRARYIDLIFEKINDNLPIVIKGNPLTGKTTLLFLLAEKLAKNDFIEENIFYIDVKTISFEGIISSKNCYDFIKKQINFDQKGKIFLLIDNIHLISDYFFIENFIKLFDAKKIKLIFTTEIYPNQLENLHLIELYPFTINDVYKEKNRFNILINTSGLPVFFDNNYIPCIDFKEVIKNRIIINIVRKYQVKDIFIINALIEYIAKNIGTYVTIKRIKDFFTNNGYNINFETIQDYIEFLVNENYVIKVSKFNFKDMKVINNYVKLYPYDTIFTSSYELSVENKLEHLTALYFKSLDYEILSGGYQTSVIPIIAKKDNQIEYYQFIDSIDNHKELSEKIKNYKKIKDFYPKYFVTLDSAKIDNILGIKNILPYNLKIFE